MRHINIFRYVYQLVYYTLFIVGVVHEFDVQNVVDSKEYLLLECLVLLIYGCVKILVYTLTMLYLFFEGVYILLLLYNYHGY